METFWGKKINVSEEAARRQIAIINTIPSEKRFQIALDFADFGIYQTHQWIKSQNPEFSELEVRLEFVRISYYESGEMKEEYWQHYKTVMGKMIRKNWANRFRKMMAAKNWNYDDVARFGRFKSGRVVEATISRGLPAFAKLAVVLFEENVEKN